MLSLGLRLQHLLVFQLWLSHVCLSISIRKGLYSSRLALLWYSLVCAQSFVLWSCQGPLWCIRAFCRKDFFFVPLETPQFGFLSCISSLRLSSGHSGPVLTLRTDDAAHASLPSPHSLVANASTWATSLLGVVVRQVFCCFFFFFFFLLVIFPLGDSITPDRSACQRVSYYVEIFPPSWFTPQDESPSLNLLSLILSLYFVLPPFEENGLPFWVPDFPSCVQKLFYGSCSTFKLSFWWIFWGETDLPILFLHHLGTVLLNMVNINHLYQWSL